MCEPTSGNPLPLITGPTDGHIFMWAGGFYQFDWGTRSIWIMNEHIILKTEDSIVFFDVSLTGRSSENRGLGMMKAMVMVPQCEEAEFRLPRASLHPQTLRAGSFSHPNYINTA